MNKTPDKYVYDPDVWIRKDATMIYLSGPMTGLPEYNFPAFTAACAALRADGYVILSPHEIIEHLDHKWEYYIRHDLIAMLMHCDSIARLPGWETSRGANVENFVAMSLAFKVYDVVDNRLVEVDV